MPGPADLYVDKQAPGGRSMYSISETVRLDQVHIDVARNSTDDFNPFHDPYRWANIRDNPFHSPIVLGFQLEFLVADLIHRHRAATGFGETPECLGHSNYDFGFVSALQAGEDFTVQVRSTLDKAAGLSNRVILRKLDGSLVLTGTVSDTAEPRFALGAELDGLPPLDTLPDRIMIPGTPYFHKRKFLNTSNGKNFCLACLVDQHRYFDELAEVVYFPPLFTAALLSNALLEKARSLDYDFEAHPVVYTRHQITVDQTLQATLRSNDSLHLLVAGPVAIGGAKGLGQSAIDQGRYRCLGVVRGSVLLFRAEVDTAPLLAMPQGQRMRQLKP